MSTSSSQATFYIAFDSRDKSAKCPCNYDLKSYKEFTPHITEHFKAGSIQSICGVQIGGSKSSSIKQLRKHIDDNHSEFSHLLYTANNLNRRLYDEHDESALNYLQRNVVNPSFGQLEQMETDNDFNSINDENFFAQQDVQYDDEHDDNDVEEDNNNICIEPLEPTTEQIP